MVAFMSPRDDDELGFEGSDFICMSLCCCCFAVLILAVFMMFNLPLALGLPLGPIMVVSFLIPNVIYIAVKVGFALYKYGFAKLSQLYYYEYQLLPKTSLTVAIESAS